MRSASLFLLSLAIYVVAFCTADATESPPFGQHEAQVSAIAFSPDGQYLAVAYAAPEAAEESTPGTIKVFDVAGKVSRELKTELAGGYALSISPSATLLAAVHSSVEGTLWNLSDGQVCGQIPACSSRAVFMSDDRLILSRYGNVFSWEVNQGKKLSGREFRAPEGKWNNDLTTAVAVSPNGNWLATNGGDRTVKVWDVASGEIKHELAGHTAMIVSLDFAPDSNTLVSTAGGEKSRGELIVWNLENGEQQCGLEHLQGVNNTIYSACFSPDGTLLAWTAGGSQIEFCDARTCVRKGVIRGRPLKARQLVFVPGGKWLASIDEANKLKLWDVRSALKPPATAGVGN